LVVIADTPSPSRNSRARHGHVAAHETGALRRKFHPFPFENLAHRGWGALAAGDGCGRLHGKTDETNNQTARKEHDMAQAIMDPEKVRRFAEELQRFNTDLENRMSMLHARFAALGDTWQDQEQAKFSEEFKQAMRALKKFVESSSQHTPYLLRKAQRIEEYLNQR
jgi:uncharacterized protein YukE